MHLQSILGSGGWLSKNTGNPAKGPITWCRDVLLPTVTPLSSQTAWQEICHQLILQCSSCWWPWWKQPFWRSGGRDVSENSGTQTANRQRAVWTGFFFFLLLKIYLFFLIERVYRQEALPSVALLPKWSHQCKASSHAGAQDLGPGSAAFPGHYLGADLEMEKPGCEAALLWDVGVTGGGSTCHLSSCSVDSFLKNFL